jgi:predicted nucleic acid-binding protein
VREFFDTSVLIAAFWAGHPDHSVSLKRLSGATKGESACGVHTVAEVYATMTALPVKPPIPPEQVMLFVNEVRDRLTLVALDESEYFEAIKMSAERGFTSGRVYDALLLACATKIRARTIYTWNLGHFRSIAPELGNRIRTP